MKTSALAPTTATAIVIGATGLTGRALLTQLCASAAYGRVLAVVRRPVSLGLPRLETLVCDFESWADLPDGPAVLATLLRDRVIDKRSAQLIEAAPVHGFCCLGTTIKVAGSQAAFRRVDFDYVVAFARAMQRLGAAHLGTVSALGASEKASIFYSLTKGQMERAVASAGVPSTHFVRPSLIDGNRHEVRSGESLSIVAAKLLGPLLIGPLKTYRVVHADQIAARLMAVAARSTDGVQVTLSDAI